MPGIHIDLSSAFWIVVIVAILALCAAYLLYRHTHPPVPPARRWLLTGLRGIAFILFALLLFDPILHLRFTTSTPPVLAVAFDNSKSMRIVDKSGSRASEIAAVRNASVFERIKARATVLPYTFGVRLRPEAGGANDTLKLDEGGTDIAAAMHSLAEEQERHRINAVLLVSDGTYTLGRDPVNETGLFNVPFYCVGIGDTSEQKDVVLTNVVANDLVYAGTQSPVRATVLSSGFDSATVSVTLSRAGRVLDRKSLHLQAGTQEYVADLSYVPEGDGLQRYTVSVSSLPGEISTANNQRAFAARVLKSKLRILLIGGEPSPEISVIRQTLIEDKNLRVRSFTQATGGTFYEGRLAQAEFDSVDCFVFVGFPTAATSQEILREITHRITASFTPILFIDGRHVSLSSAPDIAQALPFSVSMRTSTEQSVTFLPAQDQQDNPIIGGDVTMAAWSNLPPVFRAVSSYVAKPASTILGYVKPAAGPPRDPMLITRSANQEKTVALLAYGVWRWRLMSQESAQTADVLPAFLASTIKWLTTPDDRRPVRVSPISDSFPEGEAVQFTGQAYNQNAEPVEDATIHVVAEQSGQQFATDLRPIGGGRYEGSLEGLTEGEYTYRATGTLNGTTLGEDRGRFIVGGTELEFEDTRANHQLLRQIAYRTGGTYLDASNIDRLDSIIFSRPSFIQQPLVHTTDASLRQTMWLVIGIILLLATEWVIRKQSGML